MPHEQEFGPAGARSRTRLLRPRRRTLKTGGGLSTFFAVGEQGGRDVKLQDLIEFFGSGISGQKLARNPEQNLFIAQALQREVDDSLEHGNAGLGTVGIVPRISPAGLFDGTQFAFDFFNENQRIKQGFIQSEIERRFGPQGVTSQSSTVNAGVRTIIGGQQQSVTPTRAQRDEIAAGFQTPLQLILAHKPVGSQTSGAAIAGRGDPTAVSGAGIRRRRLSSRAARQTILTSDSDAAAGGGLGGATLLG